MSNPDNTKSGGETPVHKNAPLHIETVGSDLQVVEGEKPPPMIPNVRNRNDPSIAQVPQEITTTSGDGNKPGGGSESAS